MILAPVTFTVVDLLLAYLLMGLLALAFLARLAPLEK